MKRTRSVHADPTAREHLLIAILEKDELRDPIIEQQVALGGIERDVPLERDGHGDRVHHQLGESQGGRLEEIIEVVTLEIDRAIGQSHVLDDSPLPHRLLRLSAADLPRTYTPTPSMT